LGEFGVGRFERKVASFVTESVEFQIRETLLLGLLLWAGGGHGLGSLIILSNFEF
jgi:hypothetical protein